MNPILMAGGTALYLILINMVTWQLFYADKRRAELNRDRISERKLLWFAALGGTLGGKYAQRRFRHKTRKQPFKTYLNLILIVQVLAVLALALPVVRFTVFEAIGILISSLALMMA